MKVINLLGGPGCGKSTTASGLFYYMKLKGLKVELVREYVKDAVYEERNIFDDQVYIFAKQNRRQAILKDKVDWIVTDSPLLLSAVYAPVNYYKSFPLLCIQAFEEYDNYNFFIQRNKPYSTQGRYHTYEQALETDKKVIKMMEEYNMPFINVLGGPSAPYKIMNNLGISNV